MGIAACTLLTLVVSSTAVLTYALAVASLIAIAAAFLAIRVFSPRRPQRRRPITSRRSRLTESSRRAGESRDTIGQNGRRSNGAVLREKGGAGREYHLGDEPVVIGASNSVSTIVLDGDGIAPEHARIWLRQDRYLLHHVGGLSRKTYVSGQEADWVVLEPGDEVTIGSHRLVFDDVRAARPTSAIVAPATRTRGGDAAVVAAAAEPVAEDDLSRMEAAVRELWADALPASETAVGERSGTGKYKVHRRKDELAQRMGAQWVKRGRTVVLER